MIRKLLFNLCLTLSTLGLMAQGGDGCIRIATVSPADNVVVLVNNTSGTMDISDWRLCSQFTYGTISDLVVVVGDASNIPPEEGIAVFWNMDDNASDVGLYFESGSFSDPNAMADFMQYGSAGNGRESEADEAGIWEAGTFVETSQVMAFTGGCFDFGVDFWFTATSVDEFDQAMITVGPNPFDEEILVQMQRPLSQGATYRVLDITGKVVLEERITGNAMMDSGIDSAEWPSGIYFLQIEYQGELSQTYKLIKR